MDVEDIDPSSVGLLGSTPDQQHLTKGPCAFTRLKGVNSGALIV